MLTPKRSVIPPSSHREFARGCNQHRANFSRKLKNIIPGVVSAGIVNRRVPVDKPPVERLASEAPVKPRSPAAGAAEDRSDPWSRGAKYPTKLRRDCRARGDGCPVSMFATTGAGGLPRGKPRRFMHVNIKAGKAIWSPNKTYHCSKFPYQIRRE